GPVKWHQPGPKRTAQPTSIAGSRRLFVHLGIISQGNGISLSAGFIARQQGPGGVDGFFPGGPAYQAHPETESEPVRSNARRGGGKLLWRISNPQPAGAHSAGQPLGLL